MVSKDYSALVSYHPLTGVVSGRVRKCIEEVLYQDYPHPLIIVSGDLNDGPGMDFFEEFYLLFDSVDVLMGNSFRRDAMLFPVLNQDEFVAKKDQFSCIFDDYVDQVNNQKAMLDHIFVNEPLRGVTIQAAFAHELWAKYGAECTKRQEYLSDHRPVFADFAVHALPSPI